jgi:hypothetical protein
MWFFMYTCYITTLLSFVMLLLNGLQGYLGFDILTAHHASFALLTIIVYLFTETLVIFFFVGIGVSIKEYIQTHSLDPKYHKRSLAIKRRVYPPLLLNMLLMMILFISGGAVHAGQVSGVVHGLFFWVCLAHFAHAIRLQHQSFRESTAIVLEMSGLPPMNAGEPQ